jgi:hypothetical protein
MRCVNVQPIKALRAKCHDMSSEQPLPPCVCQSGCRNVYLQAFNFVEA